MSDEDSTLLSSSSSGASSSTSYYSDEGYMSSSEQEDEGNDKEEQEAVSLLRIRLNGQHDDNKTSKQRHRRSGIEVEKRSDGFYYGKKNVLFGACTLCFFVDVVVDDDDVDDAPSKEPHLSYLPICLSILYFKKKLSFICSKEL